MKKLLSFFFVFCSLTTFAQYPATQTVASDSTLYKPKGALQARIINWRYSDTAHANRERISQYPGAQISVGDDILVRDSTATRWLLIGQGSRANGLITPGIVTWSGSGLIFDVANPQYYFNGKYFSVPSGQITLDASDETYPRFDVIYVDSSGGIGKITGVAAANPVIPQVDPGSQLLLSSIYLNAGDTIPSHISQNLVYDENNEWTTSYTGTGTVDFEDASTPYHGTKNIKVTTAAANMGLVFTSPTVGTVNTSDVFKFFLRTTNVLVPGYRVQFFNGTSPTSAVLFLTVQAYGYIPTQLNTYQNISIPFSDFVFYSNMYDRVRITTAGANANAVYYDYISIQKGNVNYSPGDYSNKVDSVTKQGNKTYYWVKGIPKLIGSSSLIDSIYITEDSLYQVIKYNDGRVNDTTQWVMDGSGAGSQSIPTIKVQGNINSGTIIVNNGSVDSVTYSSNTLCQWIGGVSTCYALNKFFDSASLNADSTKLLFYNNVNLVDSVDISTEINLDKYLRYDSTTKKLSLVISNDNTYSSLDSNKTITEYAAKTFAKNYTDSVGATIIGGGTTSYQIQTASGSTDFTFTDVPTSYNDYIIFINGCKIRSTTDYTTSSNVVSIPSIVDGDVVEFQRLK